MSANTILDRLETFLEIDGSSANSFAGQIGVDPGNMRKMLAGKQTITDRTLRKISDTFQLSFEWLKYGEGEMYNNTNSPAPEISYTDGVPYYDVDFQLGFDEMEHPGAPNPEYLIRMPGYEKATLWCNASGHSMEPEINSGDILAMQRIEDFSFLPFGDIYGFITTNKDYDAQDIPIKAIAVVHRVLGAMKSF